MKQPIRCTLAVAALWLGLLVPAMAVEAADADKTIDVGDRKQWFIDGLFFASSSNITLQVKPPVKTGERTLVSDRPWENATLNWFSVMEDGGKYRMWYECYDVEGWPTTDDTSFCYAESADGIHWEKPALGLFSYHGASDNNILFRQIGGEGAHSRVHGAGVFKDPSGPPEARYRAVSQGMFAGADPPYRVAGMHSADGLRWTRLPGPICDVFADSQYSAFWDTSTSQYALYGRVSGRGRAIGRSTSAACERFAPPELVLETNNQDPVGADFYNPAAIKYPHADNVYLMFPSLYNHATDTLDIHLAVSRDGIHWSRPGRGSPFIPLGPAGSFDSGSLYMGQGMIRSGNELWLYYSGSPLKHNEAELDALAKPENQRVFSRVVSRLDGLVCAQANDKGGSFTTSPLAFAGSRLLLNVKAGAFGEVRVGLLDADGKPIAGRAVDDCIAITGDLIDKAVAWKNGIDLGGLAKSPVRMVVKMRNAELFAFRFSG
jgi:hypothetical protein